MKKQKFLFWSIKSCIFGLFLWLVFQFFEGVVVWNKLITLTQKPGFLLLMTVFYTAAFFLRAKAWQLFLSTEVSLRTYVTAVFYSLVINHLLPIKAGDIVRAGYLVKETTMKWSDVLYSVFVMRLIDLIVLASYIIFGAFYLGVTLSFSFTIILVIGGFSIFLLLMLFKETRGIVVTYVKILRKTLWTFKGPTILSLVMVSWILEGAVLFATTAAIGIPIPFMEAVWVNSFTIAGQVFHFTPGGIGTYESIMSVGLSYVATTLKNGFTIAVVTHTYKFIYSYIIGIILLLFAPVSLKTIREWRSKKGDNQ